MFALRHHIRCAPSLTDCAPLQDARTGNGGEDVLRARQFGRVPRPSGPASPLPLLSTGASLPSGSAGGGGAPLDEADFLDTINHLLGLVLSDVGL